MFYYVIFFAFIVTCALYWVMYPLAVLPSRWVSPMYVISTFIKMKCRQEDRFFIFYFFLLTVNAILTYNVFDHLIAPFSFMPLFLPYSYNVYYLPILSFLFFSIWFYIQGVHLLLSVIHGYVCIICVHVRV